MLLSPSQAKQSRCRLKMAQKTKPIGSATEMKPMMDNTAASLTLIDLAWKVEMGVTAQLVGPGAEGRAVTSLAAILPDATRQVSTKDAVHHLQKLLPDPAQKWRLLMCRLPCAAC